jgi:glucose-1-phosphate cytidylyltransferase
MSSKSTKPKVVILAGGMGMRLREETEYKPKPMVQIGPYPILWHIMKIYMHHGFNDFIVCLGYKGEMIKEYFLNYEALNNDLTLEFGANAKVTIHKKSNHENFNITLVDTGSNTMTGGRIKKIEKYVDTDDFMLTYGDGVSNVDIKKLYDFHLDSGKIATVTGVHPESRFGELVIKDGLVADFHEKPQITEGYINGGFFVMKKKIFDYIGDEDCFFEREPMKKLTKERQLKVFNHDGFWHCMDTMRDVNNLNELWNNDKAPWKVWK